MAKKKKQQKSKKHYSKPHNTNNKLVIAQAARLDKEVSQVVPQVYSCFAKVLIEEKHHTPAYVEKMFIRTQELWDELVQRDEIESMIDWCEQTTGIGLRRGQR